ncbi:hypothetical protein [Actinocorallia lasiicapitis]
MPQTGPQAVFAEPVASGEYAVLPETQTQPTADVPVAGDLREFPVRPADVRHDGIGFGAGVVPSQDSALLGHGGLTGPQPVLGEEPVGVQSVFRAPEAAAEAELGDLDSGPGVAQYAGVDMSGPAGPAKAGIPSSGNWQMPDWMREETEANRAAGVSGAGLDEDEMKRDRTRTYAIAGLSVLGVALVAALAVVVLGNDGGDDPEVKSPGAVVPGESNSAVPSPAPGETLQVPARADKPLKKFTGAGSPVVGMINDSASGLAYPRLGGKWVVPTKQNKLAQPGWTGQQIMVTEHVGSVLVRDDPVVAARSRRAPGRRRREPEGHDGRVGGLAPAAALLVQAHHQGGRLAAADRRRAQGLARRRLPRLQAGRDQGHRRGRGHRGDRHRQAGAVGAVHLDAEHQQEELARHHDRPHQDEGRLIVSRIVF